MGSEERGPAAVQSGLAMCKAHGRAALLLMLLTLWAAMPNARATERQGQSSATAELPEAGFTFGTVSASRDAVQAASWVMTTQDHAGQPFAIVEKREARLYVFDGTGQFRGSTPALLGLTPGDSAVGGNEISQSAVLLPSEQTTPAGRFASEPGHNLKGEAIVWFDYAARLAIHRLRPAATRERRPERLASSTPADNRISLGCVVVSTAFYDEVVAPILGRSAGVVYVLPEFAPLQGLLDSLGHRHTARAAVLATTAIVSGVLPAGEPRTVRRP